GGARVGRDRVLLARQAGGVRQDVEDLHESRAEADRGLCDGTVRVMEANRGSSEHVRHFQEELEQLMARLLEMGGLAEEQVRLAVKGLTDGDHDVGSRVLAGDEPIKRL